MARNIGTSKGVKAIYLFIAELNGFKEGTVDSKVSYGINCYKRKKLHELNPNSEDDRSDYHENFWLQRYYDELDSYYDTAKTPIEVLSASDNTLISIETERTHKWSVPLELDASASMLQWIGVLLNDERLMSMTNVIGDTLSDPWKFEGIPRTQFKHAATPMLYGSSKACHELWQDKGHKYTLEQVKLFTQELSTGALGVANAFKEFIINNCKPVEVMNLQVIDEKFRVECNRYRHVGEETRSYYLFDTIENKPRKIHHTSTKKVADLEQFRRYFVTGLIHNLDSQAANYVVGKVYDKYGWVIDIHDAFIVCPEAAEDVRTWYGEFMELVHANRDEILANYFMSIGIGAESQLAWEDVKAMVHNYECDTFKVNAMALK